jgi:hypothetical protein
MSVSATNTNPYYQEYINLSSDVNSVRRLNESKFQNEEKADLKYSTKEQRDIKVSEKNDEKRTIQDYNLPLQQNVPTAKLLNILKTFNETKKTDRTANADFVEINRSPKEEPVKKSSDKIGFYVVINDNDNDTNYTVKKLKKSYNPLQERINNTYHLGFRKEPGTLVNVVL